MSTINPYFTFNGNCEEAFGFYKSVFGGEYNRFIKFKDMPAMPGHELPESAKEKIMHVSLPISKETIIMGSDAHPMMGPVTIGQHLSLSVNTESKEEADKIFNALSKGGKITMPIADAPWGGAYFGMFTDKFGFLWMVNHYYVKK
jgi:PhnB protein